jgi:hypothetical protein
MGSAIIKNTFITWSNYVGHAELDSASQRP